jgi:hypothetical protein
MHDQFCFVFIYIGVMKLLFLPVADLFGALHSAMELSSPGSLMVAVSSDGSKIDFPFPSNSMAKLFSPHYLTMNLYFVHEL